MATQQLDCVLHHVRKLIGLQRDADLTDSDLLGRFVSRQDETAFATLVRRHGPLVARVCRRVLGDAHAAEDAFQATFLVLARKAASIRQRASLGGWLYEVAYHLATRARANAARRAKHERQACDMPRADTLPAEEREALHSVVDEELARLPEKYRTPLVLCYLEGKTNVEAAQQLGWPAGSMSSRLERAREMLRDRLLGRGVALSAGALIVLLGESATPAAVPAALVQNTVQAALLFAAGKTSVAGIVSGQAVVLAEGMLNTMISTKLKLVAAVLVAVGILGTGTSALVQRQAPAAESQAAKADPKADSDKPSEAAKGDVYGDPLPEGASPPAMGTLRWRHGGPVTFVGYIQNGKQLLSASTDGYYRVWDVATGKELRRFGKAQQAAGVGGGVGGAGGFVAIGNVGVAAGAVLSPGGEMLAVAGNDGSVKLYETSSGNDVRTMNQPQDPKARGNVGIQGLAFAPDGKTLVTRGPDQIIKLWEVATAKEIRQFGKPANAQRRAYYNGSSGLAFTADGKSLAAIGMEVANNQITGLIQFYEVETGKELHTIKAPPTQFGGIGSMAMAPNGQTLAFSTGNGQIHLHEPATGKELRVMNEPQQYVFYNTLVFSPDSKTLAGRASNSAAIHLYDVEKGKELRQIEEDAGQANGNAVLVRLGGVGGGGPQTLAFAPDGKALAEGTNSHTVRMWDVATGKEIPPVSGHQGGVSSLSVSPDGKVLTTLGADSTLRQWDMASGKELRQYRLPPGSRSCVLSADGKLAACVINNNAVHFYDPSSGKELRSIATNQQFLGSIALTADGNVLAARGNDGAIRTYETATGKEMNALAEANAGNNANPGGAVWFGGGGASVMAFSPDGATLAEIGYGAQGARAGVIINGQAPAAAKATVRLWNVAVGKKARQFEIDRNVESAVFTPDGRTIIAKNSDQTISLLELATGKECCRITVKVDPQANQPQQPNAMVAQVIVLNGFGIGGGGSALQNVAVSPDGKTLAVAASDRTIRLWNVATGQELGQFKGHTGGVVSVAFAPDSRTLISGSLDTTAVVWDGARFIKGDAPTADLAAEQVEALWKDLAEDAGKAYKAIHALATGPKQSVALFQGRIQAVKGADPKMIDKLVADLDSAQFDVRQKATDDLEKLGEQAQPALQKVLDGQPALETRQRIERLMEQLVAGQVPSTDVLRTLRAVAVLERVGTPEARQVLEALAKGAPGDKLTREAQTTLKRLSK